MQTEVVDLSKVFTEGKVLDGTDPRTVQSAEEWLGSPPQYHDMNTVSYWKYDVNEWQKKADHLKEGMLWYRSKVKLLEREVESLTVKIQEHADSFEIANSKVEKELASRAALDKLGMEKRALDICDSAIHEYKTEKRMLEQHIKRQDKEISETDLRIKMLMGEVRNNKAKYEASTGEKEKLQMERLWFQKGRRALERTVDEDANYILRLKEEIIKLRAATQHAWEDTKKIDFVGKAKAIKPTIDDNWFQSRRRVVSTRK